MIVSFSSPLDKEYWGRYQLAYNASHWKSDKNFDGHAERILMWYKNCYNEEKNRHTEPNMELFQYYQVHFVPRKDQCFVSKEKPNSKLQTHS